MASKGAEYVEIANRRDIEKKTHVTLPQLKYPSLRDTGLKDSVQWLQGKAMDDGAEGLWRVHNGLYDLEPFINKHPGGAEWLELSKATDITEAYECHHLSKSVDTILVKYYVRDAKTPRNSPFTFDDDGFYRTLKTAIIEELPKVPKSVSKKSDRVIVSLLATYLLSAALCCYTTIPILVNLSWLISSLTLAWTVVASRNYIHRKSNWRMHIFSLSLCSYRNISPFYGKEYFKKHWHVTDLISLLVPVWMWLATGTTVYHAFTTWLWIVGLGSLIFNKIGANAAHHHPEIWKDGDMPRIMTFYGNHAMLHLFPTLDHAVLTYLYPTFVEHAKKFRANFRMSNQFDLLIGQYKCAYNTEFKIRDGKEA